MCALMCFEALGRFGRSRAPTSYCLANLKSLELAMVGRNGFSLQSADVRHGRLRIESMLRRRHPSQSLRWRREKSLLLDGLAHLRSGKKCAIGWRGRAAELRDRLLGRGPPSHRNSGYGVSPSAQPSSGLAIKLTPKSGPEAVASRLGKCDNYHVSCGIMFVFVSASG
jgi:hypothetical protein